LASAVSAFNTEMYPRAATELEQFIQKYPDSTNAPNARLLLAQSEFKQGKFANAIATLANNSAKAGALADQYAYWSGESQFANSNFPSAFETFVSFPKNYPDSPLKLRVVVETASAYAQLTNWTQVVVLLEETNGVFQRALQMDAANELVSRGQLLLAQAKFLQKDFSGAGAILAALNSQTLKPELDWQRAYLLYQVKFAVGDLNAALTATTNLLQIAKLKTDDALRAESVALRAELLEKMERAADAIAAYQENLATNAPDERQREAILKIAALSIAQKQFTNAEQSLGNFIAQFTNAPAADVALLTLGELYLKDYVAQPPATNNLLLWRPPCSRNFSARSRTVRWRARRIWIAAGVTGSPGKIPAMFRKFPTVFQISKRRRRNCRRRKTSPSRVSKSATRCSRKIILRAR
jgi:TolA-binding protein